MSILKNRFLALREKARDGIKLNRSDRRTMEKLGRRLKQFQSTAPKITTRTISQPLAGQLMVV
jgi:hypothetical protein